MRWIRFSTGFIVGGVLAFIVGLVVGVVFGEMNQRVNFCMDSTSIRYIEIDGAREKSCR